MMDGSVITKQSLLQIHNIKLEEQSLTGTSSFLLSVAGDQNSEDSKAGETAAVSQSLIHITNIW